MEAFTTHHFSRDISRCLSALGQRDLGWLPSSLSRSGPFSFSLACVYSQNETFVSSYRARPYSGFGVGSSSGGGSRLGEAKVSKKSVHGINFASCYRRAERRDCHCPDFRSSVSARRQKAQPIRIVYDNRRNIIFS